jgi:hypothetical protein
MDPEFRYPRWQRLLEAAILEFDPLQLWVRLQEAEVAISTRLQELTLQKGSQESSLCEFWRKTEEFSVNRSVKSRCEMA